MVLQARYIIDTVDTNGDVIRSDPFKTQREVVEAFPQAFTEHTVREALRRQCRLKPNKYRRYVIRRYPH